MGIYSKLHRTNSPSIGSPKMHYSLLLSPQVTGWWRVEKIDLKLILTKKWEREREQLYCDLYRNDMYVCLSDCLFFFFFLEKLKMVSFPMAVSFWQWYKAVYICIFFSVLLNTDLSIIEYWWYKFTILIFPVVWFFLIFSSLSLNHFVVVCGICLFAWCTCYFLSPFIHPCVRFLFFSFFFSCDFFGRYLYQFLKCIWPSFSFSNFFLYARLKPKFPSDSFFTIFSLTNGVLSFSKL